MGLSQECRGRWRDLTGEDGGRGHERILCKAEPQVLGTVWGGEQQGGEGGAWCWLRSLAGGEEGGAKPGEASRTGSVHLCSPDQVLWGQTPPFIQGQRRVTISLRWLPGRRESCGSSGGDQVPKNLPVLLGVPWGCSKDQRDIIAWK